MRKENVWFGVLVILQGIFLLDILIKIMISMEAGFFFLSPLSSIIGFILSLIGIEVVIFSKE